MDTHENTNGKIGARISVSHSSVSRMRSGERTPSIDTMLRIQEAYGWSVQEQAEARASGEYAAEFERRVVNDAS